MLNLYQNKGGGGMESIIRTWLLEVFPLVIVTMGFFISMRILRFPDLTVSASFAAGNVGFFVGASSFGLDISGLFLSFALGAFAGLLTGAVYSLNPTGVFKILSSVLVMYSFYSINFRLLGDNSAYLPDKSTSFVAYLQNLEKVISGHWHPWTYMFSIVLVSIVILSVYFFLKSNYGVKIRIAGCNSSLLTCSGKNYRLYTVFGLVIANATVAVGGWLDGAVHMRAVINEQGILIDAIAALLLGELIIDAFSKLQDRRVSVGTSMIAPIIGAMTYVLLKIVSQDILESQFKIFIISDRYALVATIIFLTVLVARVNSRKYYDNAAVEAI